MTAYENERLLNVVLDRLHIPTPEQKERMLAKILEGRMIRAFGAFTEQNPGRSAFFSFPGENFITLQAPKVRELIDSKLFWWREMQIQVRPRLEAELSTKEVWLAFSDKEQRIKLSLNGQPKVFVSKEILGTGGWEFLQGFESLPLQELSASIQFAFTQFRQLFPNRAQLLEPVPIK